MTIAPSKQWQIVDRDSNPLGRDYEFYSGVNARAEVDRLNVEGVEEFRPYTVTRIKEEGNDAT